MILYSFEMQYIQWYQAVLIRFHLFITASPHYVMLFTFKQSIHLSTMLPVDCTDYNFVFQMLANCIQFMNPLLPTPIISHHLLVATDTMECNEIYCKQV